MRWHRYAGAFVLALLGLGLVVVIVPESPAASPHGRVSSSTSGPSTSTSTSISTTVAPTTTVEPTTTGAPTTVVPATRTLMLIGDSMAFTGALGLAPHAASWDFVVANEGINGCGVVRGGPYRYFGAERTFEERCQQWPAAWQAALDRTSPAVVGVVVGRWELMDRMFEGRWTNLFDPAFAAYVEAEVDGALALASSGGARVAVFTTPYYRRGTAPGGGLFPEDDPARVDVMNGILRRVAERRGLAVVDVGGFLSPEGRYTRDVGGVRVRSDGVHLTRQAGDVLAPWLFPQLVAVATGPPQVPPPPPPPPPPSPPRIARVA